MRRLLPATCTVCCGVLCGGTAIVVPPGLITHYGQHFRQLATTLISSKTPEKIDIWRKRRYLLLNWRTRHCKSLEWRQAVFSSPRFMRIPAKRLCFATGNAHQFGEASLPLPHWGKGEPCSATLHTVSQAGAPAACNDHSSFCRERLDQPSFRVLRAIQTGTCRRRRCCSSALSLYT